MKIKNLVIAAIVAASLLMTSTMALAAAKANIWSLETDLGNGLWQYDYTIENISTSGEYLYGFLADFTQSTTFTGFSLPAGWEGVAYNPTDFVGAYTIAGIYDIAPGSSLSDFSFTIDHRAGDLDYTAYFDNHSGRRNTFIGSTTVVPEPVSSTLFLIGGVALGVRTYLKRKK